MTPLVAGQYDYFGNCPPAGTVIPRSTTTNAHTDPSISLLWSPIDGVMLRGSYTTGYLPPQLSQLVKIPARRSPSRCAIRSAATS